jgi:predicted lipoprotein with Yx(FWY)xxD motif
MSTDPIRPTPTPRRRVALLAAAALVAALTGALAAVAIGSSGSFTLGSASNTTLEKTVVVNGAGRTLYALSPETTRHLLCKGGTCLSLWPPLTVRGRHVKLKDGPGVHGTLSLLHRANGSWQVVLRGKPLYRYAGDSAKGEANGEGIRSFGGTWHAATAGTSSPPRTQTTPEPAPPYGY